MEQLLAREGNPIKSEKDLGRRGQGKITYHMLSGAASVFALAINMTRPKESSFWEMYFYKYL